MALSDIEQFKLLLADCRHPLILFCPTDRGEAAAVAMAWQLFLTQGRRVPEVAASGWPLPKKLSFLPGSDSIKPALTHLQKFIIKVDVSKAPIDSLSYEVKDGTLAIYLSPQNGAITRQELRTAQTGFRYDLIITLGANDRGQLGSLYENNTDLFFRLPVVNIDHRAGNERFGTVNLVDVAATTLGEVTAALMRQLDPASLTPAIANCLYAALMLATAGFKNERLTPRVLQLASQLIEQGAERERITHQLFRTRTIPTLQLWGAALARLASDPRQGVVWSTLTREDFARSGAKITDLADIIDEIITTAPEAKITLLLYETEDSGQPALKGILTTDHNHDALALTQPFSPHGNKRQATFSLFHKTLGEGKELVLKTIGELIDDKEINQSN